jgi:hypothetical protein
VKLRFEVDQAEAFRRGIDCPKSIVTVEVDPADLTQEQRDLVADRLSGIDVFPLEWVGENNTTHSPPKSVADFHRRVRSHALIVASLPTFDALMSAVVGNDRALTQAITAMLKDEQAPA